MNKEKKGNRGKNDSNDKGPTTKKPFDKKKYRLQKYSNKYKVDQWEDRRKKAVLRNFYKDLQKEKQASGESKGLTTIERPTEQQSNEKPKRSPFFAAKQELAKKKAEKQEKRQHLAKSKEERKEALKNYKERKMQMYKKLSKKTKKGQPVMKDRLEMLLEKIKESTQAN